jgi:radical SAM superfamily enzyme YgiQ (UPF0313 family)
MQSRIPIYCVSFIREYLPLPLGMIIAYAQKNLRSQEFDLSARFIHSMDQLESESKVFGPGVFLFSDYMWNLEEHLFASAWVKRELPRSITVHGGPSFPSYPQECASFLRRNRHVDFGVVGEGERTTVELLSHLSEDLESLELIAGLRFLKEGKLVRGPARTPLSDLDQLPSPYLSGIFDSVSDYATYALIETNRGCPYGCTFCDWGSATLQKIRCFSLERVEAEIRWVTTRKMKDLYITDANFGIFERDVEICRFICNAKKATGFPERVILSYAKNTKRHLVDIVEMMDESGLIGAGVISVQSRDPDTLLAIRRGNIKNREYEKLRAAFNERQLPLDTHLMIGLPGSSPRSFREDLRYYFFEDINVRVFNTVLLPNSPMGEPSYRIRYRIETDPSGTVVSTSTMSAEEMRKCEALARLYRCAHDYGMLRYFLCFLWWDHLIDPIDFLDSLLSDIIGPRFSSFYLLRRFCTYDSENEVALSEFRHVPKALDRSKSATAPQKLIQATHIRFRDDLRSNGKWGDFYHELLNYTCARYGLTMSSSIVSALQVQRALMPTFGSAYPYQIQLAHDYVAYYFEHKQGAIEAALLQNYTPGSLTVEDPLSLSSSGSYRNDWSLTDVWQLRSELPGAGRSTLHRFVQEANVELVSTAES